MKWNFEGTGPTLVLYPETEMERWQMQILRQELMTCSASAMAAIFTTVAPNVSSCQILAGEREDLVSYLVELRASISLKGIMK